MNRAKPFTDSEIYTATEPEKLNSPTRGGVFFSMRSERSAGMQQMTAKSALQSYLLLEMLRRARTSGFDAAPQLARRHLEMLQVPGEREEKVPFGLGAAVRCDQAKRPLRGQSRRSCLALSMAPRRADRPLAPAD